MSRPLWNKKALFWGLLVAVEFLCVPALAQSNPVPFVNQPLVPDSAVPGGKAFTLTVNGTGFVQGSTVNWNNSPLATKFVTSSQLTASIPAGKIGKPATATITVFNPNPGGGTSNAVYFTIIKPAPAIAFGQDSFPTGGFPTWVGTADLNHDGHPDLITVDFGDSLVSVLLGIGDGTFKGHVDYSTASSPGSGVIGDFNGDGNLDVVTLSTGFSLASVLLGNGDGTFQLHQDFSVDDIPLGLTAGDFNGDGRLDLAFSLESGHVEVFLGNGNGTFQKPLQYPAATSATSLTAGDFNGDGKVDLAVAADPDSEVAILLGNGDGSFQSPVAFATAIAPGLVTTADLNFDGHLDLVVLTFGNPAEMSILSGKGDGTFLEHKDYPTQGINTGIALADMNGDNKVDVESANFAKSTDNVFLGTGDGTVLSPLFFSTGGGAEGIAIADFDGDGRLDLATAAANDGAVCVLRQITSILSKTLLNFGTLNVGQKSATFQVRMSNVGTVPITVSSIKLGGAFPKQFGQRNNCDHGLAPGASCTIGVFFKPTTAGPLTAEVLVTDSAVNQPQAIALKGRAK